MTTSPKFSGLTIAIVVICIVAAGGGAIVGGNWFQSQSEIEVQCSSIKEKLDPLFPITVVLPDMSVIIDKPLVVLNDGRVTLQSPTKVMTTPPEDGVVSFFPVFTLDIPSGSLIMNGVVVETLNGKQDPVSRAIATQVSRRIGETRFGKGKSGHQIDKIKTTGQNSVVFSIKKAVIE